MKLPKTVSLRSALTLSIILTVLVSSITYVIASSSSGTFTISQGIYPGAPTYTIWCEGSPTKYYAKDAYGSIPSWGENSDAATLIQATIDALHDTYGGTILLSTADYPISSTISINTQAVSLVGEIGIQYPCLYDKSGFTVNPLIRVNGADYITISNLRLSSLDSVDNVGLYIRSEVGNDPNTASRIYVDNVRFNNLGYGIKLLNCGRIFGHNLEFGNVKYGIWFEDNVINCFFSRYSMVTMTEGIHFEADAQRCEGISFAQGLIWSSTYAININADCRSITFRDSIFETTNYAIRIYGGCEISFENCFIHAEDDGKHGVYISPEQSTIGSITFDTCIFHNNGGYGISAQYHASYSNPENIRILNSDFKYNGNEVSDSGDIYFYAVKYSTIINNRFHDTLVGNYVLNCNSDNAGLMVKFNYRFSSGTIKNGTETDRIFTENWGMD